MVIDSKPSKAVVVEAPDGVSLTDAICAPAATFGGEEVGAVASSATACVGVASPASVVLSVAGSAPSQDRV
jgi:hypothetical protein